MIAYAIPLRQRTIYMAFMSSMFGIASIVGPILGGVFTDRLSWRWCFWINLPFGAVGLVTIAFFFKTPARDFGHLSLGRKMKNMDLPGAFFLITSIICLLLALQWGGMLFIGPYYCYFEPGVSDFLQDLLTHGKTPKSGATFWGSAY